MRMDKGANKFMCIASYLFMLFVVSGQQETYFAFLWHTVMYNSRACVGVAAPCKWDLLACKCQTLHGLFLFLSLSFLLLCLFFCYREFRLALMRHWWFKSPSLQYCTLYAIIAPSLLLQLWCLSPQTFRSMLRALLACSFPLFSYNSFLFTFRHGVIRRKHCREQKMRRKI